MSRGFTAGVGDLEGLAAFLSALNEASTSTGITISGTFAVEVSDGNLLDAAYDNDNEWYVIDEQVGGGDG